MRSPVVLSPATSRRRDATIVVVGVILLAGVQSVFMLFESAALPSCLDVTLLGGTSKGLTILLPRLAIAWITRPR